jgi:polyisoprenoid-binding protein YceI
MRALSWLVSSVAWGVVLWSLLCGLFLGAPVAALAQSLQPPLQPASQQAAEPPFAAASGAPTSAASAAASTSRYQIDPTHTFVHWEVLHMGTSTIRGRFDRTSGSVQFDAATARQQLEASISIDTASVNSGVPVLDKLLRGSAMLDTATHPQAYFTARVASFDGKSPREVRGEFTLRGISQPLTLRALRWNCGFNPVFRRQVCGGDFEAFIDRSTFGITHSLPLVADRVRLLIQIEAIAQP